ncbi:MAG: hypothetical protein GY940_10780, partial [bacterium]|nr:hypothetical protein [bacterium]
VKINPSVFFNDITGSSGEGITNTLDLNLFGGVFYRAHQDRSIINKRGNIEWTGAIEGEPLGQVVLVLHPLERIVTANIS